MGQQKQSGWPFEPKLYERPLLSKCSTKFLRQTDKVALVERRNLGFNSYTIGFRRVNMFFFLHRIISAAIVICKFS